MRRDALVVFLLVAACARSPERQPASPSPERTTRPAAPPAPAPSAEPPAASTPVDPLAAEAARVVERQNEAYNRHDLDGFLAAYADSVAIGTLGDTAATIGKARLRETTAAWFAEAPHARTETVDRMVQGPFVVERQRVFGAEEGHPLDAIGIYEVREGLIRRVWTIPPPPTPH